MERLGDSYGKVVSAIKNKDWTTLLASYRNFREVYATWSWVVCPDFEGWQEVQTYVPESRDGMRGASVSFETVWVKSPAHAYWMRDDDYTKRIGYVENSEMNLPLPSPVEFVSCDINYMKELLEEYMPLAQKWEVEREEREARIYDESCVLANLSELSSLVQKLANSLLRKGEVLPVGAVKTFWKKGVELENFDVVVGRLGNLGFDREYTRIECKGKFLDLNVSQWFEANKTVIKQGIEEDLNWSRNQVERNAAEIAAKKAAKEAEQLEIAELRLLLKASKERRKTGVIGKPEEVKRLKELCKKFPKIY